MLYAIIPLSPAQSLPDNVEDTIAVVYDDYAPQAWFVRFDGTARELTDLIWPDDVDEESHPIRDGVVIEMSQVNGFASGDLWEWLRVHRGS